jgi:pimeloyl-ACP methyl ester carboxylesterase
MATGIDVASSAIATARTFSPRLASSVAFAAFFSTRPRLKMHPRDVSTMRAATRERISVRGTRVVTYRWGYVGPVVVLAHGWRGRASQFAPLVRSLVADGHRVVAFDAPAHGASRGSRTDVRDWVAALAALQERYGPFRAVIGHSFGGFAALTAARHGLQTDAVVTIASAGAPSAFLDEFSRMMSLDADTRHGMERLFLRRVGEDAASLVERYDAIAHPLEADVPLLIVHGTNDRQLPATESERLHDAHPDSRLLAVASAGHTRVLASPEVLAVVCAFVDDPTGVPASLSRT